MKPSDFPRDASFHDPSTPPYDQALRRATEEVLCFGTPSPMKPLYVRTGVHFGAHFTFDQDAADRVRAELAAG